MPERPTLWMVEALSAVRTDAALCEQQYLKIVEGWSTGDIGPRRDFLHALADDQRTLLDVC